MIALIECKIRVTSLKQDYIKKTGQYKTTKKIKETPYAVVVASLDENGKIYPQTKKFVARRINEATNSNIDIDNSNIDFFIKRIISEHGKSYFD